ncbi:unnamed protein product [Effrenium voratum]|nr:unnamed protein product [Effrenium voratum]
MRRALEQLAAALAAAPQLRRLGSVQLKLLRMLEPAARGSFKLEEAVVVMEIEDCLSLFNMMLPLTTSHSRCSLKRLGLHMRAPDGLLPPHEEVEGFLCSGFASVAECLAPGGFIHFTHSQAQLAETVFFQLPFVEPDLFSGDMASCTRLASSTPLDRPLRRVEPLPELRASGTLISGPLRPTMAELASQKLRTQKYDLHSVLPEGMQLKLMHVIDRLGAWKEEMGFRS